MELLLFVPAHSERLLKSARKLQAAKPIRLVLDLEDGVPPDQKTIARANVKLFAEPQDWVRISREEMFTDLEELPPVDGIVVSKAEPDDRFLHLPAKQVSVIETALGLEFVREIAEFSHALIIGLSDLSLDLRSDLYGDFVRKRVLVAGRAFGKPVYDYPSCSTDPVVMRESARQTYLLGFDGKAVLHPTEVDAALEHGKPTAEEFEEFRKIAIQPEGMSRHDSKIVGPPHVKRAREILAAEAFRAWPLGPF